MDFAEELAVEAGVELLDEEWSSILRLVVFHREEFCLRLSDLIGRFKYLLIGSSRAVFVVQVVEVGLQLLVVSGIESIGLFDQAVQELPLEESGTEFTVNHLPSRQEQAIHWHERAELGVFVTLAEQVVRWSELEEPLAIQAALAVALLASQLTSTGR